jgi:predicted mannosyl-3-phosphoglycerate phosphatase (HAD superfamily)
MIRGLIFSDVDGTFLDEAGAVPFQADWLNGVADGWRVIFASSRTAADLVALQERVGWRDWAIAEDGSVLVSPEGKEDILGIGRDEIEARARHVGAWAQVAEIIPVTTGLRVASVLLPRQVAEDAEYAEFRERIVSADLRCSAGGRWATLTGGSDKGWAASALMARLGLDGAVAVGNDANDESLFRAVRHPFVIRNVDGHHPRLAAVPGATLLQSPGPQGWKEMIGTLQQRR